MPRSKRPTFTPIDIDAEFRRVLRRACDLPAAIAEQLALVPTSTDGFTTFRPCAVVMADGTRHEAVYMCEVRSCCRSFGVPSWERVLTTKKIVAVEDSRLRLPAPIATRIYQAGETGMGYCAFDLVFTDGSVLACQVGNAVDFVDLPDGVGASDVVDVRVQSERGRMAPDCHWLPYKFALYRETTTKPDEPFTYGL